MKLKSNPLQKKIHLLEKEKLFFLAIIGVLLDMLVEVDSYHVNIPLSEIKKAREFGMVYEEGHLKLALAYRNKDFSLNDLKTTNTKSAKTFLSKSFENATEQQIVDMADILAFSNRG